MHQGITVYISSPLDFVDARVCVPALKAHLLRLGLLVFLIDLNICMWRYVFKCIYKCMHKYTFVLIYEHMYINVHIFGYFLLYF